MSEVHGPKKHVFLVVLDNKVTYLCMLSLHIDGVSRDARMSFWIAVEL